MRKFLIVVILIGAAFLLRGLFTSSDEPRRSSEESTGEKAFGAAAKMSGLDVSVLEDVPERLEKACPRNKYGLTEAQCVEAINTRKDICAQETMQKFPGKIASAERMKEVVGNYVECIFQKQ